MIVQRCWGNVHYSSRYCLCTCARISAVLADLAVITSTLGVHLVVPASSESNQPQLNTGIN